MVESLKERRKITKIIADIKKQCYVFQHVFKLYEALITEHYTHDKKFNCSIVLARQIAIYASFTEQLLTVLNDNFVIDHKVQMLTRKGSCVNRYVYHLPTRQNFILLQRSNKLPVLVTKQQKFR